MAYLGFQKGGGANFRWPLVLTQRGDQTKFSNFFSMSKKNFVGQRGGHGTMASPKYASGKGPFWLREQNNVDGAAEFFEQYSVYGIY